MSTAQVYKSKPEGSAKASEMINRWLNKWVQGSMVLLSKKYQQCLAHRVVFAVLTENLRSNPALCARNPRPPAETVTAHRQLLTQAKVWDHGPNPTVSIGHRHQYVVGLQVSVDYKNRDKRRETILFYYYYSCWPKIQRFYTQGWIPMLRECRWASPDMACWRSITGSSPWRSKSFLSTYLMG